MSTSVLDERGDVSMSSIDGTWYVFRDNVCHGLELDGVDNYTGVWRDGHLVARVQGDGAGGYVAVWLPSGKVAARHDTRYGLIAKLARMLLHPATCCKAEFR